ncbi:thiol reductant ABC exporter subunit CydC [Tessaracoccus terricola]
MSRKPALPGGTGSRRVLALLAGLAALKAVGLVLVADALATGISQLAAGPDLDVQRLLSWGVGGVAVRTLAVWATEFTSHRAGLGAKEDLRACLMSSGLAGGTSGTGPGEGALAALASRGLDGLDNYYTKYLPALVAAAVVPAVVVVRILVADWVSALVVVLTLPLVPLFMVLIGLHTKDRIKAAAAGLDRLSNHLLELAQGLPALIGLRRAEGRGRALAKVSEDYRTASMQTLRTAFLSGLALELIATISVAVVAVFIGVRLVYGHMGLEAGLLALVLAPECYLPLRSLGAAYHSSEDGVEALERSEQFISTQPAPEGAAGRPEAPGPGTVLAVEDLSVSYGAASGPVLAHVDLELGAGAVHVLDGPSGVGKTTLLHAVLGLLDPAARVSGSIRVDSGRTAFISQHPRFSEPTVEEEIRLHAGPRVSGDVIATALADANIAHLAARRMVECSPGELRRVAVARVLARVAAEPMTQLVVADEPTAHLDQASAERVRAALRGLRGRCTLLVSTHDRRLAAMLTDDAAVPVTRPTELRDEVEAPIADPPRPRATAPGHWRLLGAMPWFRRGLVPGFVLAAAAAIFGAGLTGISGWLIVTASHQPPMLHLLVAIVGVRAFGIGRSVLRYAEQLRVHDAVFGFASRLRERLWDALVSAPSGWGRLTRSGAALGHLVAEVDEVRDALPRVLVPPVAGVATWLAVTVGIGFWAPAAFPLALGLGAAGFLMLPLAVLLVERGSSTRLTEHRVWLASRVPTLLRAAPDLRANGADRLALAEFSQADAAATVKLRATSRGAALGQGGAVLLSTLAAVLAVVLAGASGEQAAVASLLLLALGEPIANTATAVQQLPQLDRVLRHVWSNFAADQPVARTAADAREAQAGPAGQGLALRLAGADIGWVPGDPVVSDLHLAVSPGQWVSVTGPSGSGKSTLLAVLLGALDPLTGTLEARRGAAAWTSAGPGDVARVAWCPQEAHLFDSSVRSNLCLGRDPDDLPSDDELRGVLAQVGLGAWLESVPSGLDGRIGSGGHHLSGGQRQRLAVARALLARAEVLLLDEPTAHLGADEAVDLVSDLRSATAGRSVLLVTHDPAVADFADVGLTLSGAGGSPDSWGPRADRALAASGTP